MERPSFREELTLRGYLREEVEKISSVSPALVIEIIKEKPAGNEAGERIHSV